MIEYRGKNADFARLKWRIGIRKERKQSSKIICCTSTCYLDFGTADYFFCIVVAEVVRSERSGVMVCREWKV